MSAKTPQDVAELLESGAHVHVLNTTIIPPGADGSWVVEEVSQDFARRLVAHGVGHDGAVIFSHVGHQATAEAATEVLDAKVRMDRAPWDGKGLGIALQLKGRLPEGQILNRKDLEKMGYSIRVLYRRPTFLIGWNLEPGNVLGPWEELGRSDSFEAAKARAREIARSFNVTRASAQVVMIWAEGTCPKWGCTADEPELHGSFVPVLKVGTEDPETTPWPGQRLEGVQ